MTSGQLNVTLSLIMKYLYPVHTALLELFQLLGGSSVNDHSLEEEF